MCNVWQLISTALIASSISAAVSSVLWRREINAVLPRDLAREEREARAIARHILSLRKHPEFLPASFESLDGALYVTVSLKNPGGGDDR